jgi:hypothetical protein
MSIWWRPFSSAFAEDGMNGPVRFLGVIPNAPDEIAKMAKRLAHSMAVV